MLHLVNTYFTKDYGGISVLQDQTGWLSFGEAGAAKKTPLATHL